MSFSIMRVPYRHSIRGQTGQHGTQHGLFQHGRLQPQPTRIRHKFVDEEYIYKVEEPGMLVQNGKKQEFSPALARQVAGMSETDNPVIVRIRLK